MSIKPYWEKFPSFFIYPLTLDGIAPMIGFVIANAIVFAAIRITPFAAILVLILALMFIKHTFTVLDRTAQGYLGETLAHEASHINIWIGVKHAFALGLGGAAVGFLAFHSKPLGIILGILLLLAWPANVMRLALSGSFSDSINPGRLIETMTAIGLPYLGLWACLLLLYAGMMTSNLWLARFVHNPTAMMIFYNLIMIYFYLVMFRLMGYVLYQYHDNLGLSVIESRDNQTTAKTEQEQILADCSAAVRAGDADAAIRMLEQGTRHFRGDLQLLSGALKIKLASNQPAASIRDTAHQLLNLHLAARKHGQALTVVEQVSGVLPDFRPDAGVDTLDLARFAFETRKYALATRLLNGFDKRYPKNDALPDVMLLAARIVCEHQRDDAKARKILDQVIRHFPAHPCRTQAEQLLNMLDRIAAGAETT